MIEAHQTSARTSEISRILVATDFSAQAKRALEARSFTDVFGASWFYWMSVTSAAWRKWLQ